jgi:hypothetical protein
MANEIGLNFVRGWAHMKIINSDLELRPLNAKASFSGRSKKYINRLFQEITETLNGVN